MLRQAYDLANRVNQYIEDVVYQLTKPAAPVTREQFLRAAKFAQLEVVERYIAENSDNVDALNVSNPAGCTALLFAISSSGYAQNAHKARAIVNALLAAGADANIRNSSLTSPLLEAVCCGSLEVLSDLLRVENLDLNPAAYHETPLLRAARSCNTEAVSMLLNAGAYLEDTSERKYLQDYLNEHKKQREFRDIINLLKEHNEINRRQHFINKMSLNGCSLNENDTRLLFTMSNNKYVWLKELTQSLSSNNHLNSKSLSLALRKIAYKLPVIAESRIAEDKTPGAPRITVNAGSRLVSMKSRELKRSPLLAAASAADIKLVAQLLNEGHYVESFQHYQEAHRRKQVHRDIIKLLKAQNEPNKRNAFIQKINDMDINIDDTDIEYIRRLSMYHFHQLEQRLLSSSAAKLTAGDVSDAIHEIRFKSLRSRSNTPEPGEKSPTMIKLSLDTGPELYLPRAPHVGERKTGYLDPSSARPSYMVKKTHSNTSLKATRKSSSNEVSALQLLGSNAQWGTHKHRTIVFSSSVNHQPLNRISLHDLQTLPFATKLQLLISGLADLNKLHEHHLYHGDVSAHNFGVNMKTGQMKLIDCAMTHKLRSTSKRSTRPFTRNGFFVNLHWQTTKTLAHDVLMMGRVVSDRLFTDHLYSHGTSVTQAAMQKLISAMNESAPGCRCTSEQALEYCKLLRSEGEHLTLEKVDEIAQMTIDRKVSTAEDILRECARSQALK